MKKEIEIGIAEDHPLTRLGMVAALQKHKNIRVLFAVENGKELLEKLKSERPDIILLDIEMPVMRAQEVLERIKAKYSNIKVVVISAYSSDVYILECFKLGVKAFLPKGDSIEKTLEVINTVYEKGIFMDANVAKIVAQGLINPHAGTTKSLTAIEIEIIQLFCGGQSLQEIAEKHSLTLDGVNYHMRKIRSKTGKKGRNELKKIALQMGIIKTL